MKFSTLTVELARGSSAGMYAARYTLLPPDSDAPESFDGAGIRIPIPIPDLNADGAVLMYIEALSTAVFGSEPGSLALVKARTVAETLGCTLRVRMSVGADAPELAQQHWELLADPQNAFRPLGWGERTCFSRFMPSGKVRGAPRPPSSRLRAIALMASPTNVQGLAPIDTAREKAVISQCLDSTRIRRLYGSRANLGELLAELSAGCDLLYLMCHGRLVKGVPYLYFEDANHEAQLVDANEFADRIAVMRTMPPRLAVLASCDSAGGDSTWRGDGGFFASAAAKLIQAGVPAVIGMQGGVAQDTNRTFVTAFFRELLTHGQVEAATAAARMEIPRKADWWVPALLLAVDSGVLWAGGPPREFANWDEVLKTLARGECTPILGSEVLEQLSNRRVADYFAGKLRYRNPTDASLELPRISQRLKVENDERRPGTELENFYLRVASTDGVAVPDADLAASVSAWGREILSPPEFNPYRELASLRVPLFITTNPDDLLTDALREIKKAPQIIICPWKDDTPGVRDDMPGGVQPSPEGPVVFHLFGHLGDPHSVVLTEDDFFDHLIWVSQHSTRTIPSAIPARLAKSSLLFLGFHLEDWEFRVLLRNIARMQNVEMLSGRLHVAVQLDPTELTPEQQIDAQRALEDHFRSTEVRLAIYWGTVEDFLREMRRERENRERSISVRQGVRP